MKITHEFILTLKEWKGFGLKNIQAISDYLETFGRGTITPQDYHDVISDAKQKGLIKRIKEIPSKQFISDAYLHAAKLIELSENAGISMISCYDDNFPKKLFTTVDEEGKSSVPLYLFFKGSLNAISNRSVAIIGTREPSIEGIKAGRYIASRLAEKGVTIVSGLALGCDTSGHQGALDVEEGKTVAFLAHGLDIVYPPQNKRLADEIIEKGGLLMSEYPIGSGVNRYNLIARDRLQAGLSDAVVVIQTGVNGGTMHAVNAALASDKPVYAVEYKSNVPQNKIAGNAYLIKSCGAIRLRGDEVDMVVGQLCSIYDSKSKRSKYEQVKELTLFD